MFLNDMRFFANDVTCDEFVEFIIGYSNDLVYNESYRQLGPIRICDFYKCYFR